MSDCSSCESYKQKIEELTKEINDLKDQLKILLPLSVRGKRYRTYAEIAEEFNLNVSTVWNAFQKGTEDRIGLKGQTPITIRDVYYPSIKDASEKLNVRVSSIYRARKNGTLDKVGLRKKSKK